jgi:tetratricopeptide (TPR) repeat protein
MRKTCVLGILVVLVCAAQSHAPKPTPAQADAFDAGYRVTEDVTAPSPIQPPGPQVNRPPAGSVSVAELRHKPHKNALKSVGRGARFSQAGDHRRAAEEFEKAVAVDPEFVDAYCGLGVEYTYLGRYAEAEAKLRRSLTLDPNSVAGYYDLAVVLEQTGDLPSAERSTRQALELSQTDVQVHLLLGLLLWHNVETRREALEHLQYAARSSSEAKELLANLRGK